MIQIPSNLNDDKNFIGLVEQICNVVLNLNQPEDVFIIKVDRWFDFKWRQFSHQVFGDFGIWRERLRIPPFIPDRIVEEIHLEKTNQGYKRKDLPQLHIYQHSDENNHRKINNRSAIFAWFSGDTVNNSQASLMVYVFKDDFQSSWYISFIKKADWQIYKTDNISKSEVKAMLVNDYLALIR